MKKLLLAVFGLIILLAGCSSKPAETVDTTLEFWIPGSREEYPFYYEIAESYTALDNGVTINTVQQPWSDYWTKLPLEVNNGRGPDLFVTTPAYSNVTVPISAGLDITSKELEDMGFTNVNQYIASNGNPSVIPVSNSSMMMYYNKELWSSAGLTEKDIPTTWEEFEVVSAKLSDPQNSIIGFDYSFSIALDLMIQNNIPLTDEEGHVNYSIEVLELIKKWEDAGISNYMTYGAGSPEDSFLQGSSAIIYGHNWMDNYFKNTMPDLKFGTFRIPTVDGAKYTNFTQGETSPGININLVEKQMEESQKFMNWMLSDEDVMLSIAYGFNGASPNLKYLENQNYEDGTAGVITVAIIEQNQALPVALPVAYEEAHKVLIENVITNKDKSIASEVETSKKQTANDTYLDLKEQVDKGNE